MSRNALTPVEAIGRYMQRNALTPAEAKETLTKVPVPLPHALLGNATAEVHCSETLTKSEKRNVVHLESPASLWLRSASLLQGGGLLLLPHPPSNMTCPVCFLPAFLLPLSLSTVKSDGSPGTHTEPRPSVRVGRNKGRRPAATPRQR